MKILITGGTGFIGSALCAELKRRGSEVTSLGSKNGDLIDPSTLKAYSQTRFDRIFHLAAWTRAGDFCLHHPGEQWILNQLINSNVLTWWKHDQPQAKLIAIGTSCSYDESLPHAEENYLRGDPTPSLYTYAMTKRMVLVGLQSLRQQFGLSYLHVVPSTVYGPGYHEDGRQMHFIFDLIRKILLGKIHGEPVVLWGDGHQRRELVYIDDFLSALVDLSELRDCETINIGAGDDHSIREFAMLICEVVGYDFDQIRFDTERYVGARSKRLVTDRVDAILPHWHKTDLKTGLKKTIEWMKRSPQFATQLPSGAVGH